MVKTEREWSESLEKTWKRAVSLKPRGFERVSSGTRVGWGRVSSASVREEKENQEEASEFSN